MKHDEKSLENALFEANNEIRKLKDELKKYQRHNARGAGRKSSMTEEDKQKILEMRREGVSYNKIAAALHLPVGSVFNYSKLNLNTDPTEENRNLYKRFTSRNIMSFLRSKA